MSSELVSRMVSLLDKIRRVAGEAAADMAELERKAYVLAVIRRIRLVLDEVEELAGGRSVCPGCGRVCVEAGVCWDCVVAGAPCGD